VKLKPLWFILAILLLPALACDIPLAPPDIDTPPPGEAPATLQPTSGVAVGRDPGAPQATSVSIPTRTPVNNPTAEEVIETYAREVLDLDIEVTLATSMVQDLDIPLSKEQEVESALALSGVTYFGIWPEGMAAVALGEGGVSGDFLVDVQDASLGAFSTRSSTAMPTDAASALALLQATYPGLLDFPLVQDEKAAEGFVFTNTSPDVIQLPGIQATLQGTVVRAGVAPGGRANTSVLWTVIASGLLATPFK